MTEPRRAFGSILNGARGLFLVLLTLAGAVWAEPGRIDVFFGSRDGELVEGGTYVVGTEGPWIGVGDLNGDGVPDLAFVDGFSGTPGVLLGTGDGRFERVKSRTRGIGPAFGSLRDMDADGNLDLVLLSTSGGTVAVLKGRGDGTLLPPESHQLPEGAHPLLLEDLDRDGREDLISVGLGNTGLLQMPSGFAVHRGLADGTLSEPVFSDSLLTPAMVSKDFDGDGIPDLAATHLVTGVFVYPGRGDGTFDVPFRACTGLGAFHLASGDLNGDGKEDLVVSSMISGITVLRGNGDGTFTEPDSTAFVSVPTPEDVQRVLDTLSIPYVIGDTPYDCGSWSREGAGPVGIGDWNGDGAEDVVLLPFQDGPIEFLAGRGDGTLLHSERMGPGATSDVAVADLNGDGISDVVVGYGISLSLRAMITPPRKPPGPPDFTHGTLTFGVVSPQGKGLQYGKTGWGLDLRLVPRVTLPGKLALWTDLGFNTYPGTDSTAVVEYRGSDITAERTELEWSIHLHAGIQAGSRSLRAAVRPRIGLGLGLTYFGTDETFDDGKVHFSRKFNHQFRPGWRAILGMDIGRPRGAALNLEVVYDHVWNLNQLPGGFGAEGGGRFLTFRVGAMFGTTWVEDRPETKP